MKRKLANALYCSGYWFVDVGESLNQAGQRMDIHNNSQIEYERCVECEVENHTTCLGTDGENCCCGQPKLNNNSQIGNE